MSLALVFAVGGLVGVGTYLVTARSLSRIVLGFSLLGHASVLALLAAGNVFAEDDVVDIDPNGNFVETFDNRWCFVIGTVT